MISRDFHSEIIRSALSLAVIVVNRGLLSNSPAKRLKWSPFVVDVLSLDFETTVRKHDSVAQNVMRSNINFVFNPIAVPRSLAHRSEGIVLHSLIRELDKSVVIRAEQPNVNF